MGFHFQHRSGLTLIELIIVVGLISILVYVGSTTIRTTENEIIRSSAQSVTDVFRRARYVAARQNRAVSIVVRTFDTANRTNTSQTRGSVEAYLAPTSRCNEPTWSPTGVPFSERDFGDYSPSDGLRDPGIVRIEPSFMEDHHFCVRPNGRIVDQSTNQPIQTSSGFAGNAVISVQYNPFRVDSADQLIPPYMQVEVPYNGIVRVIQYGN